MKMLSSAILTCLVILTQAQAGAVLFNFDNAPLHSPLPLNLTVDRRSQRNSQQRAKDTRFNPQTPWGSRR